MKAKYRLRMQENLANFQGPSEQTSSIIEGLYEVEFWPIAINENIVREEQIQR